MPRSRNKISITLVIAHLGLGGAERMLALLANHWASKGWRITFMTLDHGEEPHFYPLDATVNYLDFGWSRVWKSAIPKLRMPYTLISLRRALKLTKPDLILSFLNTTNVSVLMATYKLGIPVVVSERNDPHYDVISNKWERLRRLFYPTASCMVAQTQNAFSYFSLYVQAHGCVIPNPVLAPDISKLNKGKERATSTMRQIVAVGRLAKQKGFDLLLRAFAKVAPMNPGWLLTIWGEGDERSRLESMVNDLHLNERVCLPGKTQQIYEKLHQADMFVLSSRFEGFPNALCEAMACGLPVISFNCPSGPSEIIRDGVDGILVPREDVDKLAETMELLIKDESLRMRLSIEAPQVRARFSIDRIFDMWESVVYSHIHQI